MNATAPLMLPVAALKRTARLGRSMARVFALPALGAAAAGMAFRAIRRPAPSWAAPEAERPGPVAVTQDPGFAPVGTVDPETLVLPSELPIHSYDALAARDATRCIRELTDPDEVATVLQFEEENAKRPSVLTAARTHLATLRNS